MIKYFTWTVSICLLSVCSCENEFHPQYSVPPELQKFVDAFEQEAAKRGHPIQIDNLIIVYDNHLPEPICGNSNIVSSENNVQKTIRISLTNDCWNCQSELETLLFHEMGHCILGRGHDNGLLPKGYPRSIMYANGVHMYTACGYDINGDPEDLTYRRDYYLDELFTPATPVPDWGK